MVVRKGLSHAAPSVLMMAVSGLYCSAVYRHRTVISRPLTHSPRQAHNQTPISRAIITCLDKRAGERERVCVYVCVCVCVCVRAVPEGNGYNGSNDRREHGQPARNDQLSLRPTVTQCLWYVEKIQPFRMEGRSSHQCHRY